MNLSRPLRTGLVAGVVLVVAFFAPMLVVEPSKAWFRLGERIGYTTMVLAMSATWFAMARERRERGALGFGRGLAIGAAVSAVAAVLFGLATYVFYVAYGDTLVPMMLEWYAEQARAAGDPAVVARKLAELEAMKPMMQNYGLAGLVMAATVFLIGIAESVLGALWLRRAQNEG
jgi:hypothetical protein